MSVTLEMNLLSVAILLMSVAIEEGQAFVQVSKLFFALDEHVIHVHFYVHLDLFAEHFVY